MDLLINTIIYIMAVMGIILTIATFFEMLTYKNICSYKLFNKKSVKKRKITLLLNFKGVSEDEVDIIISKLKTGAYNNLEDLVDSMQIEKE